MDIRDLAGFDTGTQFEADLVIVGGGPAGLTIAREFAGTSTRVLLLESGLEHETPEHTSLAEVESVGEPRRRSRSARSSTARAHRAGRKRPSPTAFAAARSADQPMPGPANPPPSMPSIFRTDRGCLTPAGPSLDRACPPTWIAPHTCSISDRTSTMTSFGN